MSFLKSTNMKIIFINYFKGFHFFYTLLKAWIAGIVMNLLLLKYVQVYWLSNQQYHQHNLELISNRTYSFFKTPRWTWSTAGITFKNQETMRPTFYQFESILISLNQQWRENVLYLVYKSDPCSMLGLVFEEEEHIYTRYIFI